MFKPSTVPSRAPLRPIGPTPLSLSAHLHYLKSILWMLKLGVGGGGGGE